VLETWNCSTLSSIVKRWIWSQKICHAQFWIKITELIVPITSYGEFALLSSE
jgi:hypothetical protein